MALCDTCSSEDNCETALIVFPTGFFVFFSHFNSVLLHDGFIFEQYPEIYPFKLFLFIFPYLSIVFLDGLK